MTDSDRGSGRKPRVSSVDIYVGQRMRARRIVLGLTQQQLADLIGVTYQQSNKYEQGVNRISAARLHTIAEVLGVSVNYFFEGLDSGEPVVQTESSRLVLEIGKCLASMSPKSLQILLKIAEGFRELEAARRT